MLKRLTILFLLAVLGLFLSATPAHAVTWTRANEDGFGDTTGQDDFFDMIVYNNCLYAGIESESGTEGARVHRTCDGTTWTQVNTDGFGDPPENDHVDSFAEFNNHLYVSTAVQNNSFNGFKLWRSTSGDLGTWEAVVTDGFGDPNNENLKALTVFNGWLCGGTWNGSVGTAVWCSQDGTNWTKKSPDGFGNSNNTITWFATVFKGYLYISAQNVVDGGQIWRTNDLSNWSQVGSSGYGYGAAENLLRGLLEFKGALYSTAKNGSQPTEIIRSKNGTNFQTIATFSDITDDGPTGSPHAMIVFNNILHIATNNPTNGFSVYRSSNGSSWTKIASGGIDDSTQKYGILQGFNGYLYVGTRNLTVGQKVWRTNYNTPR